MQQLIEYIKQFTPIDDDVVEALTSRVEFVNFKKNEFILTEGGYCNHLWFLKSGMVRKYHLIDGEEVTVWIHCENEVFTSMPAYIQQQISDEYLQACEDTVAIGVPRSTSEYLGRFPQMEVFAKKLIETHMVTIDSVSRQLSRLSAKEKYEKLRCIAPEMMKRAKLGHIASLMGIKQETLSRIRAER